MGHKNRTLRMYPEPGLYVYITHNGVSYMFIYDAMQHVVAAILCSSGEEVSVHEFPKRVQETVVQRLCEEKRNTGISSLDFEENIRQSFLQRL